MKPIETFFNKQKREKIIQWVCLLYGGFAILLFLFDLYSVIWLGTTIISGPTNSREADRNYLTPRDINRAINGPLVTPNPIRTMTSPASILVLLSGLISLAGGITIHSLTKEKEVKKIKQETADFLLLPEEKKVIETLKRNNYSLTQSKITKETGLTKVQVHRVLKRLELKGLIEKHEFGLTNKIVLKKEFLD